MRLFLNVAAVLLATPLVVLAAKQTASSTCETYTLKCSTSKTAWAGKTTSVEATLYNKAKGSTEDVEIGLYWNTDDFSYDKSKFSPKGYTAQTDDDSEVYYEGVAMKKSVKIQTALNVDKCAATTATVGAWASIGDCDLDIDCPVIDVKYKKGQTCSPTPAPTPAPTPSPTPAPTAYQCPETNLNQICDVYGNVGQGGFATLEDCLAVAPQFEADYCYPGYSHACCKPNESTTLPISNPGSGYTGYCCPP